MANQHFTCTLHAWREGTTLYAYMTYARNDGLTYWYQDTELPVPTMDLGGVSYQDSAFKSALATGFNVGPGGYNTTTFSRTVSGTGTRTVTWTCGAGLRDDFQGTWSVDVGGFPGTTTPPSGGSITNVSTTADSITATVSLTSWGTGTTGRILRLAVLENGHYITTVGEPQYVADSTDGSLSATLTVNNNSTTYNSPSWTIQPNTQYDIGIYAETADGSYRYDYPSNPVRTAVSAKMYGSVNGQAKKINKLYGSVNGARKKITKLYGSVNGQAELIYEG